MSVLDQDVPVPQTVHVAAELSRNGATGDENSAFEVVTERRTSDVGAPDQRDPIVDHQQFSVEGRTGRSLVLGPRQSPGDQSREWPNLLRELRIVDRALHKKGDVDTASRSIVQGRGDRRLGMDRESDEQHGDRRAFDQFHYRRGGQSGVVVEPPSGPVQTASTRPTRRSG